jgi:hypothetical protein
MTRAQVHGIAQSELGIDVDDHSGFPWPRLPGGYGWGATTDAIGDTGLMIDYDDNGCGSRISALFGIDRKYAFTLFGNDICEAFDTYVIQLCKEHWTDIRRVYGGLDVPSAGFSASYWDSPSDERISAVAVEPRRSRREARAMNFDKTDDWETATQYRNSHVRWEAQPPNRNHVIYEAMVERSKWKIRLNDFPDEPLFTLLVDDVEIIHFNDWPKEWTKPT